MKEEIKHNVEVIIEELAVPEGPSEIHDSSANKKHIAKKELMMFAIGGLGQGMIYATMSSYISDYYITVLKLSPIFVLLLMLLARVWDAVNDPLMGMIVDKYKTPWGRMKPYILFSALPIGVLTFFMFFNPHFSNVGTMVYCSIIYIVWGMIYTVSDVPFWTLPNIMTPNPKERASTISFGRMLNGIGSAIPMGLFLVLGFFISNDQKKYSIMAILASCIGITLFISSYFFIKEKVNLPPKPKVAKAKGETLKRIFKCKPLMLVVIMGILSSGRYLMQAAAVHVARYAFYIGPSEITEKSISASISIISTVFSVCSAVGMFGAMLFMPALYKRFDYKKIVIVTCVAGFFASIITTVLGALSIYATGLGWLFYVTIPFLIIQCIPLGALNVTSYAMIGDSLDYMEWKTGFRDNALGSACQSFVNKLGNALATTFVIAMYLIVSLSPSDMYAEQAVIAAVNLENNQRFAMFSLVSLIPGLSMLVCAIPVFFYDLVGKKKQIITEELAARREAAGVTFEA